MAKVFFEKELADHKEYLKNMLDCIDENGKLSVGRFVEEDDEGMLAFCVAESEEKMTHIEKIKLDKSLADYESLWQYFEYVVNGLQDGSFLAQNASNLEKDGQYGRRMLSFAQRTQRLMELNAPKILIENEKTIFLTALFFTKQMRVAN